MDEIDAGLDVFVHDGKPAIGVVRSAPRGGEQFSIYVENGGEFSVPRSAVIGVYREELGGKVVLDCNRLDANLRRAISHAHDAEDPDVANISQ